MGIRIKKKILVALSSCLIIIVALVFIPTKTLNTAEIIKTHVKSVLVDDILMNNDSATYDKKRRIFYFSDYSLLKDFKIGVKSRYKVNHQIVGEKNKYYLFVYSDKFYEKIPIVITNTPIINIIYPDNPDIDYFNNSNFIETTDLYLVKEKRYDVIVQMLYNKKKKANTYSKEDAVLNIRGTASALFHPKKSYKLKFTKKLNMFNIVTDDVVALDALSTDNSKIRNILSSDIWNYINDDQNINNDLFGDFVEVFINGQYTGLYVLKSKVNKGTSGIDNDGLLVKDIAKNSREFINALMDDRYLLRQINRGNKSDYYLNYQIKYYTESSFINFVYKLRDYYSKKPTYDVIDNNFYMNNYVDYMLFVLLISGKDNIIYNKYYSLKNPNSKILLTPWDMDLTFGLDWAYDLKLKSVSDIATSYDKEWLDQYINDYADKRVYNLLKKRYLQLRKNVITSENINSIIDNYEEKIIDSDAYKRDIQKWEYYDIKKEIKFIRRWVKLRIKFLDEYFGR